ncbi:MAG: hypothetical protein HY904_15010 [Deltaproteobacteria bacterium]|nr:hypothetical protein [Deltaproteobacteria bacterium]
MNPCPSCQVPAVPGAIVCGGCGAPLPQAAGAAPCAAPSLCVQELVVVDGGTAGIRLPLPPEGTQLTLGRHDLTRTPPWVVDVDLGRYLALTAGEGIPISRDQAALCRRAGELTLTPRGAAPTLHRPHGQPDYRPLATGQAHPIRPGDRLVFGHAGRVLVLEAH